MTTFGRFSVAMATPFSPDGTIDLHSTKKLAKHLVDNGCDSILVSGTTGEAPATHAAEKVELLQTVRAAVGPDIKILAGVSSNDTQHCLAMTRQASQAGANGVLVTAPYYNRPSQNGIYEHIKAVHNETHLPVMIYDIPGRVGVQIEDNTLDRLAELPRVKAVKDATGNVAKGIERMRRTGLEYYSGDDSLNLFFMAGGAHGVISVVGHIEGKRISALLDAIETGNLALAQTLDTQLSCANHTIMGAGQGATYVKQAIYALGIIDSPHPRLPLVEPSPQQITAIKQMLKNQGFQLKENEGKTC